MKPKVMLSDDYQRVRCLDVKVERSARDRKDLDITDLLPSIKARGVYNPIILHRDMTLIAGERRLAASLHLGLETIPARFADQLTQTEAKIIELEENVKRQDLTWQETCRAYARLRELHKEAEPDLRDSEIAERLGISYGGLIHHLRVAPQLHDPRIAEALGLMAAFNMISRTDARKNNDAIGQILQAGGQLFSSIFSGEGVTVPLPDSGQDSPTPPQTLGPKGGTKAQGLKAPASVPPLPLLQANFLDWAPAYQGPPFNFIHCDFGLEVFGPESTLYHSHNKHQFYNDTPKAYWQLIDCLCLNLDRLMAPAGHLMFWFPMSHYNATLATFHAKAPGLEFNPFPLVWIKSDNAGTIPDPKRGPRHIYESALFASREDHFIVKPIANAYSAPTDKTYHPSTKPEPMLRHFFQMFVDSTTRLLDPTCGSGTALRAAESLGAAAVLGLESDPEHFTNANTALTKFRALRKAG